jgi:hypothetical protein
MEPNTIPVGRINLPNDLSPEGVVCVSFPCPDDPQYIAMIIGLVDVLKWSATYQRDATGNGAALVSRVWDKALATQPVEVGECGGEVSYLLRDDPNDPCKVEQSTDGGVTWTHAFDKGCEESGQPTPTEPAAEGAGNFVNNVIHRPLVYLHDNEPTQAEFEAWYCDWIETIAGSTVESCLDNAGSLWEDWQAYSPTEKDHWADPCTWYGEFQEIQSCFDDAGVMDWLNCASQTVLDWLEFASVNLMRSLTATASVFTGTQAQNASDHAGTGGGAGFGDGCGTSELGCNDLKLSTGGFVRNGSYGIWQEGVGWKAELAASGYYELDVSKTSGFPPDTLSVARIDFSFSGNGKHIELYINGALVVEQNGGNAGYRIIEYPMSGPLTSVRVKMSQNTLNNLAVLLKLCMFP